MATFVHSNLENVDIENFNFEMVWIQNSPLTNGALKNRIINTAFFIDFNMKNVDLDGTTINELIEAGSNNFECKNHSICKNP